jgi:predicted nucleic acid-binding protein
MAKIVVDSNVVIAYLDDENINHLEAVASLSAENIEIGISSLSMTESLIHAFRNSYEFAFRIVIKIEALVSFVLDLTRDVAIMAAQLSAKFQLNLPDSIILATAEHNKLSLWTFDRRLASKSAAARYLLDKV